MPTTFGAVKEFPLEEEYKKPTGITPEDISKLREWLHTQPHLPGDYITDLDLILTYHSCERSTEVSKQLIDLHYTMKTIFTRYFKDRTVDENVEAALSSMLVLPLPTRTRDGYAVLYTHFLEREPRKFFLGDILRAIVMVIELWQYSEGTWPGFVMMCNVDGVSLGHLTRFELSSLQQFLYFIQEALLVKLKGFHILNTPSFWDSLYAICHPFAKKSPLEMVITHAPGLPNLDKVIPVDALPKEAGGSYKSVEECRVDVISWMKANNQFFVAENSKRVVEALRPGAPKTISDIFGSIEGTFKQLEID